MCNADKRSIINMLLNSVVNKQASIPIILDNPIFKVLFNRFCKLLTIDYYIVIYHEYI